MHSMKSEDDGFVADEERSVSCLLVANLPKTLDFGSIVLVKIGDRLHTQESVFKNGGMSRVFPQ